MFSWYAARVFSKWLWNSPSRPYYYFIIIIIIIHVMSCQWIILYVYSVEQSSRSNFSYSPGNSQERMRKNHEKPQSG